MTSTFEKWIAVTLVVLYTIIDQVCVILYLLYMALCCVTAQQMEMSDFVILFYEELLAKRIQKKLCTFLVNICAVFFQRNT